MRRYGTVSTLLLMLALLGFIVGLVIHALTFVGIDPRDNFQTLWYVLQVSSALCLIPALIFFSRREAEASSAPPDIYTTALLCGFAFFVAYAIFNFLFTGMVLNADASPEIYDGQYVLYSHGAVVRKLTAVEFMKHKRYEARLHSGHWMFLYLLAAAAIFKQVRQR